MREADPPEMDENWASRNVPKDFDPRRLEPLDPISMAIMSRKSPIERLDIAFRLNRFIRERIRCDLAVQYPDWSAAQIQAELARRMLSGSA